jgi:uncharacterized protein
MKLFIKLFSFIVFTFNLNSQNLEALENDSLKKTIEEYRKDFWVNLPKPTNWTNDYELLFSETEENMLNNVITEFENETSFEIGIITIDTLKTSYKDFDKLTLHIANTWGVGKKDKDNGMLIAISKGHRRIRIENGNYTEKLLSDDETLQIIQKIMIPKFKEEKYFEGTLQGLIELIRTLKTKI